MVLTSDASVTYPDDQWFAEQLVTSGLSPEAPPERFRLGIHFERIFQYWLSHHPQYELIASNLQVQIQDQKIKRTLGEFDLLVNLANQIEHWELAIKFYINVTDAERADRWFGPDPSDTLGSKMARMQSHQLALGQHPAAKQQLADQDIHIDATRCIVKGRLYQAFKTDFISSPPVPCGQLPDIVNTNHMTGWWLAANQIEALSTATVAYIDKQDWLSPITADDQLEVLNPNSLRDFLAETKQIAPQFVLLGDDRCELSRGFVLKPEWFDRAGLTFK